MNERLAALRACDLVLRASGVLVPADRRQEWLREWRAELWHEAVRLEDGGRARLPSFVRMLRRSLGSLPDGVAMRRFHPAAAQEDFGYALMVVFRSPGAAGLAIAIIALATALDTVLVNLSGFTRLAPPELGGIALCFASAVAVLLAFTACIAATAAIAWSDAARQEEAMRRAMGVPDARLRRQRALENLVIAALGSAGGAWLASGFLAHTASYLEVNGSAAAQALLRQAPGVPPVALCLGLAMTLVLPTVGAMRLRRLELE